MFALIVLACSSVEKKETQDTGETVEAEPTYCERLELTERVFDATAPSELIRHAPAGDFSVELRDGVEWRLSENWTGCDNYVFIPHGLPISQLDSSSFWNTDVSDLIAASPENTHYFFVVTGQDPDEAELMGATMSEQIDLALSAMGEVEAAWWADKLHVVADPSVYNEDLVGFMFRKPLSRYGWAIDRAQSIRTLGSHAAVDAYDPQLNNAGAWPWEYRLASVGHEAVYFNFEAQRQDKLDAQSNVTTIEVFDGAVYEEFQDGTLRLPDSATMQGFDTMELDIRMECPDPTGVEIGNCGAWDYLAHLWLYDDSEDSWLEMGRFITTYHRESRWVVDATHALAWLQEGGDRTIRYSWAPSWNTQQTGITLSVRLFNQGKGMAPRKIVPLFTGGSFNSTYNDREAIDVEIDSNVQKVELVVITTGHGMDSQNCAEFCDHSHHFTVGGQTYDQTFPAVNSDTGCQDTVHLGTVPNQGGTWWFGRGGWCPGREVEPFVVDVTGDVVPGAVESFSYSAKLNGNDSIIDNAGNIELRSWAVMYW